MIAVACTSLVTLALAVPTARAARTAGTLTPRPDASARLFDPSKVHEVSVTIPADQLSVLKPGGDERARAQLTVDGKTLANVGVRVKQGLGSFRWLDGKTGFSVKTDEFVDGQAIFGEKKFTLNNSITDPSFVADQLTYDVFRAAGIPAPRTALANLHVNGELFGLYVLREALDKRFLERNFRDPDGNLYEAPFDVDIGDTRMELRTNETKNDKSDVAAVGAVVADAPDADFLARVRTLVDLREFFRYWAVETITAHWDGYASLSGLPFWDPYNTRFDNYRPNNYYTYSDPSTGKFVFLPWGADLSLGNLLYMGSGSSVNALWPPKEDARLRGAGVRATR